MENILRFNDAEVNALIRLVEDPDPQIYSQVKHKLVSYGASVLPNIESTWLKASQNNDHQSKLQDIISEIRVSELCGKMQKWKDSSNRDLLKGALIISQFQYPNITELMIEKEIEKIQQKVWLEINDGNTAFETVKIFNNVLFEICGFKGSRKNFFSPNNSFLYSALRQKQGTPLTLSIIYSIVAQRLEIPIYGVNLPNQFILGFVDEYKTLKMLDIDSERQVLFYINPYAKGRIFDHNEIEGYLKALKLPIEKEYYEPCSNTVILKRMLSNLCYAYKKIGDNKKVEDLKKLNLIL